MGIFNLTPDSFYDGVNTIDSKFIKEKLLTLKYADIIDVGAESTRPFSKPLLANIEIERLDIFLNNSSSLEQLLSIDSYKPEVIEHALKSGFNIINDISGGGINNSNIKLAASYNVPIIIMHMQGSPKNMQVKPVYENIIDEILQYFEIKIDIMKNEFKLDDKQIILDPGIGFGKTKKDNYTIINNIHKFKSLGFPVLIGLSRKSFLSFDKDEPKDRKYSSLTAQLVASINGADCIRTHDVKETYFSLRTLDRFKI